MKNKLWSVKAYTLDPVEHSLYVRANEKPKKTSNPARIEKKTVVHLRRRVVIINNNLPWMAAKKIWRENRFLGAFISPAVVDSMYKIQILGEEQN